MNMRIWMVLVVLAGCGGEANPPQYVHGSNAWLAERSPEERAQYYHRFCVSQNFEPGTMDYANCVVEADQDYQLGRIRNDYYARFAN